jgi:capsular exopolysaccharide synthesis family protein
MMSKFLDRMRNAQQALIGEVIPTQGDPDQWVEVLRKPNGLRADIEESRLAKCRKTRLAVPPELPSPANAHFASVNAMEAYRMLRTRLMRAQAAQGLRTLIFSSAISNEGKTLTTLNLAQAYVALRDQQRVLLIDGDMHTRAMSQFFEPSSGPGLPDTLVGDANFADVILATDKPNLFFVSAGKNSAPPELYASKRWREFLAWCSESFKVILIDAPPIFPLTDFDLMSAVCDGIVLVVRAQRTSRDVLQKAAAQIDSKKLLGIVYNATQSENHISKYNNPYLASSSN